MTTATATCNGSRSPERDATAAAGDRPRGDDRPPPARHRRGRAGRRRSAAARGRGDGAGVRSRRPGGRVCSRRTASCSTLARRSWPCSTSMRRTWRRSSPPTICPPSTTHRRHRSARRPSRRSPTSRRAGTAASERDAIAQSALVAATTAVERAREAAERAEEPEVIGPSREELAVQHADASAQVRRLSEELAGIVLAVEETSAARVEVEAATAAALAARQAAAVHCSEVAARLDAARERERSRCRFGGPGRGGGARRDAGRRATPSERRRSSRRQAPDGEPPADRLARVEAEIEAVERKLAVFGPADVDRVADELEPIRALDDVAPVPDALDLAAELAELEDDLARAGAEGSRTPQRRSSGSPGPPRRGP